MTSWHFLGTDLASMWTVLFLALAGGAGAACRFVLDGAIRSRSAGAFSFATVIINVCGSMLIGVVTGLVLYSGMADSWRLVLATGFCGGFTTFSTAMVESAQLARTGRMRLAVANALGTLLLTCAAVAIGIGAVYVL